MATLTLELPDDAFAALRLSPKEFADEMRLAAAMFWYSRGRISHGRAAEIAGINRVDFIDALAREKVDAFHVDFDDLREEVERGLQAYREHVAADPAEPSRPARHPRGAGG